MLTIILHTSECNSFGGCEPNFTTTTITFNTYNYGYNKQRNHH